MRVQVSKGRARLAHGDSLAVVDPGVVLHLGVPVDAATLVTALYGSTISRADLAGLTPAEVREEVALTITWEGRGPIWSLWSDLVADSERVWSGRSAEDQSWWRECAGLVWSVFGLPGRVPQTPAQAGAEAYGDTWVKDHQVVLVDQNGAPVRRHLSAVA